MPRFTVEQLGSHLVVDVDLSDMLARPEGIDASPLDCQKPSPKPSSDTPAMSEEADPTSIETLVSGLIWVSYNENRKIVGLTMRLKPDVVIKSIDTSALKRFAREIGLASYRRLREEYIRFAEQLVSLAGVLPAT